MKRMKLYLLSQSVNTGYETYDSMVVAAPNEATAQRMAPYWPEDFKRAKLSWAERPEEVTVELIGTAKPGTEQSVICSSFNAG